MSVYIYVIMRSFFLTSQFDVKEYQTVLKYLKYVKKGASSVYLSSPTDIANYSVFLPFLGGHLYMGHQDQDGEKVVQMSLFMLRQRSI